MKANRFFYVLDKVSETIIGNFWASTDAMAVKILKSFDFKKANLDPSDVFVCSCPECIRVCETYDEVIQSGFPEFHAWSVIDLNEDKDGKSDK